VNLLSSLSTKMVTDSKLSGWLGEKLGLLAIDQIVTGLVHNRRPLMARVFCQYKVSCCYVAWARIALLPSVNV
jgi:hypothetical protein